jgi:aryl-alcohol dehydrogenase-like predicted oxidoreductase
MSEIRKRRLGRTGLDVTEVGLGTVFLTRQMGVERQDAVGVIHRALELGVNYVDTAPLYGDAQEVVGEALAGREEDYILSTKCGRWKGWTTGPFRDLDAFKAQFEESLKLLRRDSVDILYIHEADFAIYWEDMEIPRTKCEMDLDGSYDYSSSPVAKFLRWAKQQGMVRHLGISGNNAHLLAKVLREIDLDVEVVLVAFQYSLIWRNAREYLLPLAKEMDVGVVLGAPLQQGRLAVPHEEWLAEPPEWMADDTRERFAALYAIQKEAGMTLAELGGRFLLADPDFAALIPGAANVEQLEENVACSAAGPLPKELHDRLDALGKVFAGLFSKDY